jgi:hypothetical protein
MGHFSLHLRVAGEIDLLQGRDLGLLGYQFLPERQ